MRPVYSDRRSCSPVRAAASPPPTITMCLTPSLLATWCSYHDRRSVLQGALVDGDLCARQCARAVASQPDDDIGYLVGRHEPLVLHRHWREAVHVAGVLGKDLHHRLRLDHRGGERVGVGGGG